MNGVYFNDNDDFCAQWLHNLHPDSTIDGRDINEVRSDDVSGFRRCHFFGGIGAWEYALHLAGWPEDCPVWSGSCPCQPFSVAGRQKAIEDPRHLWPVFFRLIRECRPPVCFGEQVESNLGRQWLARVRSDLEAEDYAVGCADLCAASAGSPIIRQRLFWVAQPIGQRVRVPGRESNEGSSSGVQRTDEQRQRIRSHAGTGSNVVSGRVAQSHSSRRKKTISGSEVNSGEQPFQRCSDFSHWDNCDILSCNDGKLRRTQSGLFPLVVGPAFSLADGRSRENVSRAKLLKAIGNSICPQAAAAFIKAFMDIYFDGTS